MQEQHGLIHSGLYLVLPKTVWGSSALAFSMLPSAASCRSLGLKPKSAHSRKAPENQGPQQGPFFRWAPYSEDPDISRTPLTVNPKAVYPETQTL